MSNAGNNTRLAKSKSAANIAEYYQPAPRKKTKLPAATDPQATVDDDQQDVHARSNGATRLIDFNGVPTATTSRATAKSPFNKSWQLRPPTFVPPTLSPATTDQGGTDDAFPSDDQGGTATPDQPQPEVMPQFEDSNGTDGPDVLNKLSSIKVPWDDDVKYFFFEIENQMEIINVQSQWIKRVILANNLPPRGSG